MARASRIAVRPDELELPPPPPLELDDPPPPPLELDDPPPPPLELELPPPPPLELDDPPCELLELEEPPFPPLLELEDPPFPPLLELLEPPPDELDEPEDEDDARELELEDGVDEAGGAPLFEEPVGPTSESVLEHPPRIPTPAIAMPPERSFRNSRRSSIPRRSDADAFPRFAISGLPGANGCKGGAPGAAFARGGRARLGASQA
jgi:hypothetical protein